MHRESELISFLSDLSLDARILYVSTSIEDILGYGPQDVIGKSCWEYFHPDEIPFARAIHGRGVRLDKAAVLNYCQIKNRDGRWVGCECVFTIVHDVMVGCTSVYRRGLNSHSKSSRLLFCWHTPSRRLLIALSRTCERSPNHSANVFIITTRPTIPHAFIYLSKVFKAQPYSRP